MEHDLFGKPVSTFPDHALTKWIYEAHLSGGHVSSAVMGLIAGGKDIAIVNEMCAKYGLDPKNAS